MIKDLYFKDLGNRMRTVIFAVSRHGAENIVKIKDALCSTLDYDGSEISVYIKCKNLNYDEPGPYGSIPDEIEATILGEDESLEEYIKSAFKEAQVLIFVCAMGIAVRMIAPFITHKAKDPAVLVMDEKLRFCIPLLSGHLGGANELAMHLAAALKAEPVITTASDINGITAVDMFAKSNALVIDDLKRAKEYTAALLCGKVIYVINEAEDATGRLELPEGYIYEDAQDSLCGLPDDKYRIYIKYTKIHPGMNNASEGGDGLVMIPRCLRLGIGCRRGVPKDRIEAAVRECFDKHGLLTEAIEGVYSIDLKKDEEGISGFCEDRRIGFRTFSAEVLKTVEGNYTSSDFVKDTTGVDNVCERSVMMAGRKLLVSRETYDGITLAVAI